MSMGLAALIVWLLTASIGAYMLRTWVARGGLRRQRMTGAGVPPPVVFGHASAALAGLAVWISYLGSGWRPLAWIGVALACAAICLGICTVTLWTPYPVRPGQDPGGPEEPGVGGPRGAGGQERRQDPAAAGRDAFTVTDEMIAGLLAERSAPRQRQRRGQHLLPLIPVVHGFGALTTFLLTVTTALLSVR